MNQSADAKKLFEALLREHAGSLAALLHAMLDDKHAVDDLFQETCVVAWRQLHTFDQSRPFGPWLRGIARNLLLRHARRRKMVLVPEQLEFLEEHLHEVEKRQGDTFLEKIDLIRGCVDRLPEKYRGAIEHRYLKSLSHKETAETMGISIEGLKKRLLRGRNMLRSCLERHGIGVRSE